LVGTGDSFEFRLQDIAVTVNQSSKSGLIVDFTEDGTSEGMKIATGDPDRPMVLDMKEDILSASVGYARLNIMNVLTVEGGLTFQRRVLNDADVYIGGLRVPGVGADALIIGGKNISAFAGINGPYLTDSDGDFELDDETPNPDAIGFAIADLDFGLVLANPSVLGQRIQGIQFIGAYLEADYAGLVGTDPWVTMNIQDVKFGLNIAVAGGFPIPGFIDFSSIDDGGAVGLDIPIGTQSSINLGSLDAMMIRIGMQANMGLFGLFEIEAPAFDFTFKLPDSGELIPSIDLSGLLDFEFDISPSAPSWLGDAIEYLKNIELSISADGITGSLEIPNLTIELGEFIYFNGDFKLTLGDTFTADAFTGIDPMFGGVADTLLDLVTQELGELVLGDELPDLSDVDALQRLLGFSSDFSRIYGVKYEGYSFGASNVNLFIGAGNPNFDIPLDSQGLIGFGLQNLDVAFGYYEAKLPGLLGTVFNKPGGINPITSFKASADE
jgi:hypothetical protein